MKKLISGILCIALFLTFAVPASAAQFLTEEEAAAALTGEFDMELRYVKVKNENRAILVYMPMASSYIPIAVSAVTGRSADMTMMGGGGNDDFLIPEKRVLDAEEIKREKLLSEEEITKIIRGMTETVFSSAKIVSVSYEYSGYKQYGCTYLAEVVLKDDSVSATVYIDAKTGMLDSFLSDALGYNPSPEVQHYTSKHHPSVRKFLNEKMGFSESDLMLSEEYDDTFVFWRAANEIPFSRDSIRVYFDPKTGKIEGVESRITRDIEFDNPTVLISKGVAKKLCTTAAKPKLSEESVIVKGGTTIRDEYVYWISAYTLRSTVIDAKTGYALFYSGDAHDRRAHLRINTEKLGDAYLEFAINRNLLKLVLSFSECIAPLK